VLGFNHTEVGSKIAEKWNLPDILLQVIRYHHQPASLPHDASVDILKLVTIVHLADIYTMMLGSGLGGDGMMYTIDFAAMQRAGIPTDEVYLENLLGDLVELNPVVRTLTDAMAVKA
jgi:HD-like signal output (HDOD) protein